MKAKETAMPRPSNWPRGPYSGVFTVDVNGTKKADIQQVYSYWNDGAQSFITRKGHFTENNTYPRLVHSFKDFDGNTIFISSTVIRKARWGSMFFTVATLPDISARFNC